MHRGADQLHGARSDIDHLGSKASSDMNYTLRIYDRCYFKGGISAKTVKSSLFDHLKTFLLQISPFGLPHVLSPCGLVRTFHAEVVADLSLVTLCLRLNRLSRNVELGISHLITFAYLTKPSMPDISS